MDRVLRRGVWVPCLLCGLVAAFFWKILFSGRAIGGLDVLEYFYPYRSYARQAIDGGRLPLWNPDIFGGVPFLANIQAAIFYPPNVLFYVLSFPAAYTASVLLHCFLGALFAYLFARQSLGLARAAGLVAAVVFVFGGFMGGQVGHLNQLQAAAWLPAALLCWDKTVAGRRAYVLVGALVIALQFLAGHTQESYYILVTLLIYAAARTARLAGRKPASAAAAGVTGLAVMVALGAALAAIQLVPTSELTSWSIRANGLSYAEATTFSLKITGLLTALLPPFWNRALVLEPGGTEFLGYVSVTGLVLALVALTSSRRAATWFFAGLAALALFFALGQQNPLYPLLFKVVPGFNLFRVPARWLFVYSFCTATLAGLGMETLIRGPRRHPRRVVAAAAGLAILAALTARFESLPPLSTRFTWLGFGCAALLAVLAAMLFGTRGTALPRTGRPAAAAVLAVLVGMELWLASQSLDYNHPTAARLFGEPIGTLAYLDRQPAGGRALSVAQDTYVPGVESTARRELAPLLGTADLAAYLSYYKLREILEPNTSLAAGVPTIDGYDGGLLPLARYVRFKDLLTERPSAPDDRIRFVVKWPPNRALLNLAGVRYLLTDALADKKVDGVSYDLSSFIHLDARRPHAEMTLAAPREAASLGFVLAATANGPIPADTVLGRLTLSDAQGRNASVPLILGPTGVGQLPYSDALPTFAAMVHLDAPLMVTAVSVDLQPGSATDLFLNGLALIDARGQSYSPLAAPGLEMQRVFQADVKLYANPAALGPAFLVHDGRLAVDSNAAAAAMDAGWDPARQAIIEADPQPPPSRSLLGRIMARVRRTLMPQPRFTVPPDWLGPVPPDPTTAQDQVAVVGLRPESVVVDTTSSRPGFLVLTESFYPGWQATVDGEPAHLLGADLLFQAVHLPAGRHRVELVFRPRSVLIGCFITLAALLACCLGFAALWWTQRSSRGAQAPGEEGA